ncbi:GNAT family N-acetyltransferase [Aequorivita sediminis]|uniref:GNAT family N-acetyltransferase n=1 Tax=Aequorivita sediminis TaxID=3073653 RepID=UPI0028B0649A|nr:GNAT family N-acetyltransferase [Aequorivita sp. F6058]
MEVIDNKDKSRFEAEVSDSIAFVEYTLKGEVISITHTEVPKALAGQGIGSKLTEAVLKNIEKRGLKMKPLCPFTKKYIDKNPEWSKIVV